MNSSSFLTRIAGLGFVAATSLSAATFDLVTDFNLTNGPGSPFTYGRATSPATFSFYNGITPNCLNKTGETCYNSSTGSSVLYYNGSGSETDYLTIQQPTNFLALDPQELGVDVRFVAPSTANYSFAGNVKGLDTTQATDTFQIFVNGLQVGGNSSIAGNTITTSISFGSTPLPAGTVVDFLITGPETHATGGLNGTITSSVATTTPEPSTWLALGSGLVSVVGLRFRRKSA
jgi:hypothetical protein